ncbi:MAG: Rrf2 family transcriptional regulator [Ignavibacteriae bacterium]|nr:Rrf2 family transcriptional regulator [Ignavibacteriota bacterium]MCB0750628.1 Rrf2 family transcriptional regulator [Ignavibacteriota bacterium]MCB9210355.1 Rrf2 family transcriptional regulator [Ignavibacteriales bacterium]MCB9219160.1 Rrf2 family transcriptional regulator [Ignavibacteriales bacterium]MCB9259742.1 Rrf2 family transcriptional regulator [Ignavibacteriales bacterium]
MRFTSQEEYGLRLLLRLGYAHQKGMGLTIPEISTKEQITEHNVAKILRVLRLGGFLESERGRIGGYTLTKNPDDIIIGEVMSVLGGKFFESSYCENHSTELTLCTHTPDCSIRSFWKILQSSIDKVMNNITLSDLMQNEKYFFEETSNKITSEEIN